MSRKDVLAILDRTSRKADDVVPTSALVRRVRRAPRDGAAMTITEAKEIAGMLGHPSKLPGFSYGLHAKRCHRGQVMAQIPGSICRGCFALKGYYATWWPALVARDRHHEAIVHPRWVDAMVTLINHYCRPDPRWSREVDQAALHGIEMDADYLARGVPYFRWHDSGDLQSLDHLTRIVEICRRTPEVMHWLPTREYEIVLEFRRAGGTFPANLAVRLSALFIDAEPPRALPGVPLKPGEIVIPEELADLPTSTVHTPGAPLPLAGKGSIPCRAIELRDNQCGPCRACWSTAVRNVSYPQH